MVCQRFLWLPIPSSSSGWRFHSSFLHGLPTRRRGTPTRARTWASTHSRCHGMEETQLHRRIFRESFQVKHRNLFWPIMFSNYVITVINTAPILISCKWRTLIFPLVCENILAWLSKHPPNSRMSRYYQALYPTRNANYFPYIGTNYQRT